MRKIFKLPYIILFALVLSACSAVPVNNDSASNHAPEIAGLQPTNTITATSPAPTATLTPMPTLTAEPTVYIPPTQRPDCNAAELVSQDLRRHTRDPEVEGRKFTIILRLTNTGSCIWTKAYQLIVAQNQGMEIEEAQNFTEIALPGETVDLEITLVVPDEPDDYNAIWLLQDAHGDIFGLGPDRNELITMDVLVTKYTAVVNVNDWLFPAEGCFGQVSRSPLPRFGRLMHDPQWMPWASRMLDPEWPSNFYSDWYPETVQFWTKPNGGDGRFPYSKEWLQYLRVLQANDEAAVWIARVAAGLFNKGNDFIPILNLGKLEKEPVAESISSGGNVVLILEISGDAGRLEMLYFDYSPPSLSEINYFTTPWLITKFTSVSIDGVLGNAGGINVYFPNLSKDLNGYWVDMQRVELFPHIPYCAKMEEDVTVYQYANLKSDQRGVIPIGERMLIREYLPQGSEVWGRIYEGWILLEYQVDGRPVYPTSWTLETRPPILFR